MSNHLPITYNRKPNYLSILTPLEIMLKGLKIQNFKKGKIIFQEGKRGETIFFVESGIVQVKNDSVKGKIIAKNLNGKGCIFGELLLAGFPFRQHTAKAVTDVRVIEITRQELSKLLIIHPNLSHYIFQKMGERIQKTEKRFEDLILESSRNRIIKFLLFMNREYGQKVGFEHMFSNLFTHNEISKFTSTSRQTVTTTLNELKSKNLITVNRRRVLLRDLNKLIAELN